MNKTLSNVKPALVLALASFALLIAQPTMANHETYTPYGGSSNVTKEYSYQRMIWNNVSAFSSTRTYEHETVLSNSGFAKNAAGNFWDSNLPRGYRDTQFADNNENYAVGSAQASSIAVNQWYFSYYDLQPENPSATTSSARINGQLGYRSPSWCYSTWCIFGISTYGLLLHTAPSGISWIRP